jgi:hypothetical protein
LLRRFEVPGFFRAQSQPLHSFQDVLLLSEESVTKFLRPAQIMIEHCQCVGNRRQRYNACVPALAIERTFDVVGFDVRVVFDPPCRLDDFERISRGHQHLREQSVWIKRDRRHQLFKFRVRQVVLGVPFFDVLLLLGGRLLLGERAWSCEPKDEQAKQ